MNISTTAIWHKASKLSNFEMNRISFGVPCPRALHRLNAQSKAEGKVNIFDLLSLTQVWAWLFPPHSRQQKWSHKMVGVAEGCRKNGHRGRMWYLICLSVITLFANHNPVKVIFVRFKSTGKADRERDRQTKKESTVPSAWPFSRQLGWISTNLTRWRISSKEHAEMRAHLLQPHNSRIIFSCQLSLSHTHYSLQLFFIEPNIQQCITRTGWYTQLTKEKPNRWEKESFNRIFSYSLSVYVYCWIKSVALGCTVPGAEGSRCKKIVNRQAWMKLNRLLRSKKNCIGESSYKNLISTQWCLIILVISD